MPLNFDILSANTCFTHRTEWRLWTVFDGLTCLVPELRHIVVGQLYVGITQGLHVVD